MKQLKYILNSSKSKESVNKDSFVKLSINSQSKILHKDKILYILNLDEQFNKERQNCSLYRFTFNINSNFTNTLFNISDITNNNKDTLSVFNNLEFLSRTYPQDSDLNDLEDLNYKESLELFLKEKNGWFGYLDPDITKKDLCGFNYLEPKLQRFSLTPDLNPYKNITNLNQVMNWGFAITYPFSMDKNHKLVKNGLLIIDTKKIILNGREMTVFYSACKHNLNIGDEVEITNTINFDGIYSVYSLDTDLDENGFILDIEPNGFIGNESRFNKIVDGNRVNYYFRLFKKINEKDFDYNIFQPAFAKNIYSDDITQLIFNEDFDIKNLKDNLNRPISELFLTVIKTNSNNLFTNLKSGIKTPFFSILNNSGNLRYLLDIPVIQKIHNSSTILPFESHKPLETNILYENDIFYGDLVEYNPVTLLETTLSDIYHRFNTINRETKSKIDYVSNTNPLTYKEIDLGPRYEGYMYNPHYKIKIRNFSEYIENGDDLTDNIPDYRIKIEDGTFIWRDLLPIGFKDTNEDDLDYPFLNGYHYIFKNIIMTLKRQDPYGLWGLLYTKFPSDPIGEDITNRYKFKINKDVC